MSTKYQPHIEWLGNIVTFMAAGTVATWPDFAPMIGFNPDKIEWWAFSLYFVGNILWFFSAYMMKNTRLGWLNIFFMGINAWAMITRF